MLETCGVFFNRGAAGKKLDYFLSFFQVRWLQIRMQTCVLTIIQYYIHTKISLPMDIEFAVQDTFASTRPQWKLAANLEEAAKVFQLAVTQDQKSAGIDKSTDADDAMSIPSSDDELVDGDDLDHDDDGDDSSTSGDEENEV
jgi:regulator of nonsense transcripts 2